MTKFLTEFEGSKFSLPEYFDTENIPRQIPSTVTISCNIPGGGIKTLVVDGIIEFLLLSLIKQY